MDINLERKELEKIYGKISPFEFKNQLINLAESSQRKSAKSLLDAGRGNPNWIASTPRDAFFTFGHFATEEARRTWSHKDLAGIPQKFEISNRFFKFLEKNSNYPGVELLKDIINYGITYKNFDPDEWVFELTNGILGCDYPVPERMLTRIEGIVHDYLIQEMCYNNAPSGKFDIFAVEGATSAMCYLFNSLNANKLLHKGDKIALMTPIFTPYLEIPTLPNYDLEPENIKFIDRLVADSRQVALNHTAGLSTPQQVQMAFFSIFALLDKKNIYKELTMKICHTRKKLLFEGLGLPLTEDKFDACYYSEFDLLEWATLNYGIEFANYLKNNFKTVDVLFKLAKESSIVLLSGGGFSAPEWSVRISLANLRDEAYLEIGMALRKILDDFAFEWKNSK